MEEHLDFYLTKVGFSFPGNGVSLKDSKYVLFGVPFDSGSSAYPGSRFGPLALRQVVQGMELWSQYYRVDLENMLIYDAGDAAISHGDFRQSAEVVQRAIKSIASIQKFPIMVGGEHTFTPYAATALEADSLIVLDAHADCRKDFLGNPYSHACATRLWLSSGGKKVLQIGTRATSKEERDFCAENDVVQISPLDIRRESTQEIIRKFVQESHALYLSIDMDAFDPAFAPGVGTPEPFGLFPVDAFSVLNLLKGSNVVGLDVMELCPPRDPSFITSALASKLIMEFYASREK